MTTTNGIAKHYACLTPWERFACVVAANVRGDNAERDRLVQSAPKKTYQLPHYFGLTDAMEIVGPYHLLEVLDSVVAFHIASGRLARDGYLGATEPESRTTDWWPSMKLAAYVVTVRIDGWRQFCTQLGIDPEIALEPLPGYKKVKLTEKLIRQLAFTPEQATAWLQEKVGGSGANDVTVRVQVLTAEDVARSYREFVEDRLALWS